MSDTATFLNAQHISLIVLSGLIAGVGFFDFTVFMYLTDAFNHVFFTEPNFWLPQNTQVMGLFLIGYVAMPVGGFLIGRYGDKYGRKMALCVSLIVLGLFTLTMSILPIAERLGIIATLLFGLIRFGQGFALGGLIPSLFVFISEHLHIKHLGVSCGIAISGSLLGVLLSLLFVSNLENTLTHDQIALFGWRLPFLIGGSLTCCLLILVRNLDETPIFKQIHTPDYQQPNHPISGINFDDPTHQEMDMLLNRQSLDNANNLSLPSSVYLIIKKHRMYFLPALILSWKISSLFVITAMILPYLVNIGFVITEYYLHIGNIVSLFFMMIGSVFYGLLVDRFNVGKIIKMGSFFLLLQVMLFFGHLKSSGDLILVFFALLGFASGVVASSPVVIVRLFPAKIRLFGVALTFSTVFALANGLLPFLLSHATFYWRLTPALYLTLVILATIFISFHISYLPRTDMDMER